MSKRKIIIEPDPILRKKSVTLEKVDNDLRKLMDDMLETMYSAPGIGLAAVQIGILKRVVVIDLSKDNEKKNIGIFPGSNWEYVALGQNFTTFNGQDFNQYDFLEKIIYILRDTKM